MTDIRMIHGDCLQVVPTLPAHSFDAIITDVPYGSTACDWDVIIPFDDLWRIVKHALKPRGVFVTTASQPFTSRLVCSNLEWFKYEWIWRKNKASGHLDANRKPMKSHENVIVFCDGQTKYNPQMEKGKRHHRGQKAQSKNTDVYGKFSFSLYFSDEHYPQSVIEFSSFVGEDQHPTQKPISLYEYLIRTYTNPGDTVLDFCAGSGTTIIAAINTGRNAIGIELREDYYQIAQRRIAEAQLQPRLFQDEQPKTQAKQEELF